MREHISLDTVVQALYTKLANALPEKVVAAVTSQSVSFLLTAISSSFITRDIVGPYAAHPGIFLALDIPVYGGTSGAVHYHPEKLIDESGAVNWDQYAYKKLNGMMRLPLLFIGIGSAVGGAISETRPDLGDTNGLFLGSIGCITIASLMYLKDRNPRSVDKVKDKLYSFIDSLRPKKYAIS